MDQPEFGIELVPRTPGERTYYLEADSEETRQEWKRAIEAANSNSADLVEHEHEFTMPSSFDDSVLRGKNSFTGDTGSFGKAKWEVEPNQMPPTRAHGRRRPLSIGRAQPTMDHPPPRNDMGTSITSMQDYGDMDEDSESESSAPLLRSRMKSDSVDALNMDEEEGCCSCTIL